MLNTENLVSFIIPTFNSEDTLEECIWHIRKQAEEGIEVIVVDNGSSDSTADLAKRRADIFKLDETANISKLRNIGAKAAKGEYLIFVDSDCLLEEGWLELALDLFKEEKVAMVGSKSHKLPADSTWVADAWKCHLDRSGVDPNPHWLVTRALALKKDAFFEVGGFDDDKETCEDVALGHAVSENYKIVSDNRLSPIHLKDASTLGELFSKELWRGIDSIRTSTQFLTAGRVHFKELLSLALPFYFSFFPILLVIGLVLQLKSFILFSLFGIFTPILAFSLQTAFKVNKLSEAPQIFAVYATYIAARTLAIFKIRSIWKK